MRFLIFISLLVGAVLAQLNLKTCLGNEFCINIKNCSSYKQHTNSSFKNWPAEIQQRAKNNICNTEVIDKAMVISVCCPTVMNSQYCGIQGGSRITVGHGQRAMVSEFPWMALLQNQKREFVCGGSLISRRYVLTAAHCVKLGEIVSVRLGENNLRTEIDCYDWGADDKECAPEPQDIKVEKIIGHSKFSNRNKQNDIALIKLDRLANLGETVSPICLPSGNVGEQNINPHFLFISGWGLTENGTASDVLMYARVSPVPLQQCTSRLRRLDSGLALDSTHICATGFNRESSCPGDSGGPLQYISNKTSRFIQYGVVAFGPITCGIESEPGVYTNVLEFLSWIVETVDE